jgi:diguanylate cyclase (GGDEF)-like protein
MQIGRARSGGGQAGSRGRLWATCLAVLALTAAATFAVAAPLSAGIEANRRVDRNAQTLQQVTDLRADVSALSATIDRSFANATPADAATISNSALAATAESKKAKTAAAAVAAGGFTDRAAEITKTQHAFETAVYALGPVATGLRGAAADALVGAERAGYTQLTAALTAAQAEMAAARDRDARSASGSFQQARSTMVGLGVFVAVGLLGIAIVFARRLRRREHDERTRSQRHEFEASLQDALEMAKTEPAVYEIVRDALTGSVPGIEAEVLVADSSRAHFHKVLDTSGMEPGDAPGCGVASPLECPATTRGHTLTFASSGALNACPYLKHGDALNHSAVCVPISIAGNTVGVTHATGPDGSPPSAPDIEYLELTSRRASERIGMLRAFEKSEAQARSDALTGLWNRRSLENRVRDLQREGTQYTLAYGDLDHFKALNDTHGHEAGDQALRLFSRVLRDSIRPNDVAARYGGEEFVVLLPECNVESATIVLERVRERLALALTAGRVPAFTVSFGIASSSDADTFDEVLAVADHALLSAKAAGRNRVLVAVESLVDPSEQPSEHPTAPPESQASADSFPH